MTKHREIQLVRLRVLLEDLLGRIESGHKQSIGSIDNVRMVQFGTDELARYRSELAAALQADAPPQEHNVAAKVRLADDIVAQVKRRYHPLVLPTKGSTTVYADAVMVQAIVSAPAEAPQEEPHGNQE